MQASLAFFYGSVFGTLLVLISGSVLQQHLTNNVHTPLQFPRVQNKTNQTLFNTNLAEGLREHSPRIFVGVVSAAASSDTRAAIRLTWGRDQRLAKVAFVVARPASSNDLALLRNESDTHGDVVVLYHIYEHYRNITYQTHEIFRIAYHLRNMTHVVKVDDDSFVHVQRLVQKLMESPQTMAYLGRPMVAGDSFLRDPAAKNYVGPEWNLSKWNMSSLPRYGWGTGYIVTIDLAVKLATVPLMMMPSYLLNLEDVAVGLWIDYLVKERGYNVRYISEPRINIGGCSETDIISHFVKKASQHICMFETGKCCK